MISPQNSLNNDDWVEWLIQTLQYSVIIPGALLFLTSLQNGVDVKSAALTASYASLSALLNLVIKFKSGLPQPVTPPVEPVQNQSPTA